MLRGILDRSNCQFDLLPFVISEHYGGIIDPFDNRRHGLQIM